MKVIIAGGRNFIPEMTDYLLLLALHRRFVFEEVVSGACSGADAAGETFAYKEGIKVELFPADWIQYGKAAGPIRNKQMAEYADAVILFPGGPGTANMRNLAKEYGLKILYDAGDV